MVSNQPKVMKEAKQLLQEAANEIKQLRARNEVMAARLDMFDSMMALLHTDVSIKSRGQSVDLVWEIEEHLKKEDK